MSRFTCGIAFGAQELEMAASAHLICAMMHLWTLRGDSFGSDPFDSAQSKSAHATVPCFDFVRSEGGVVGVAGGLALKGRCLPPHFRTLQRVKLAIDGAVSRLCA